MQVPSGWHSRGYLPHFDGPEVPQFITFRLADSLPQEVLRQWKLLLHGNPPKNAAADARRRIELALDQGYGGCLLRADSLAQFVESALLHFDGQRYHLHAWVIMPNHVHTLTTPAAGWSLSKILFSWKSFTAHAINKLRRSRGTIWEAEYFDRFIRTDKHFLRVIEYIEENPAKAGLCKAAADWKWSSARLRAAAAGQS